MPPPPVPLEAIRQPAFLYGPGRRIVAANDLAEALAGRPLAGSSCAEIVGLFRPRHPDGTPFAPEELPACRALAGREAIDVPFAITLPDGRTLDFVATAAPVSGGALVLWQDVTAARRAESEREALGRFPAKDPNPVLRLEHGRTIVFANPAARALLGAAAPAPEADAPVEIVRAATGALAAGALRETEYVAGDDVYLLSFVPLKDRGYVNVYGVRITGRVRAEAALRESEAVARSFMENMVDGCAICETVVDGAGEPVDIRIVDVNPAFLQDLPLPAGRVVGHTVSSILPEMDRAWFDRFFEIGRTGRAAAFEEPFPAFGRWHQVAAFPVRGGRIAVVLHDITEQRRAEEAVRERERVVQGIFRAAPAGIGLVSGLGPGRRFEEVNDRLLQMSGYSRDELVGQDSRVLYLDDGAYAAVGRDSARQLEAYGRGEVETRWRRKDGSAFSVLLSSSLIDPQAPRAGVIFIAVDLTALHESQRSLQRYARDLRRSNEELQRFAYAASHDLQEPLRSIVSFSQLLDRRYRGRLGTDADEYIAFIVEGGVRMQALIKDLLQLSRVETRARPPVPTDANGPVGGALRSLKPAICEAGATVTVDDLPVVVADPVQLEQVFVNLVGNAVKYRRPDRPLEVRVSAERRDGVVEFAVADNGIGIEAEYYDRIFEMFRRLHTHDQYEGTGIGLSVVKKIVERHGGSVRVESTPGEGSTFFFSLPAA